MQFSSISGDSSKYATQSHAIILSLGLTHILSHVALCLTARQKSALARSSLTLGCPDRATSATLVRPSLKALTHFATVLYGKAVSPHHSTKSS